MLEIVQWFNDRDRFVGLILFVAVVAMAVGHVVAQFRNPY